MTSPPRLAGDLAEFGRLLLGPWLVAFCDWIHETRRRFGDDTCLIFVARDGHLPLAIYETLHPEERDRIRYVLASRNANSFAEMTTAEALETFHRRMARRGRVREALTDRFHLADDSLGDDPRLDLELGDPAADACLAECLASRRDEILARAAAHREIFRRTLTDFVGDRTPVVVDIGYRANTQRFFAACLGRPVAGLYLVTHDAARAVADTAGPIAAFDGDFLPSKSSASLANEYRYFFEAVLSAPAGTFLHYEADGTATFSPGAHDPASRAILARIHAGARAAAEAARAARPTDPRTALVAFLRAPAPEDAALFRGFCFDDPFMGEADTYVVCPIHERDRCYGLWVEGQRAADRLADPTPASAFGALYARLEDRVLRWYLTKSHWARAVTNRSLYLRTTNDWKLRLYGRLLDAFGRLDPPRDGGLADPSPRSPR
jgi:hypothetical protein